MQSALRSIPVDGALNCFTFRCVLKLDDVFIEADTAMMMMIMMMISSDVDDNEYYDDDDKKGRKEMFYLTTHPTHFIYCYMASDIW